MKNHEEPTRENLESDFSRVMLSEEYLTNSICKSTPGSRRVTPSKTLPTEVRTPNSKKERQFGGSVHRISVHTVHGVLTAEIKCNYLMVDCRYQYEYSGGHILGAINCPPNEKLMFIDWLFSTEHGIARKGPLVLIMHCEFSQCRAPRLATDVLRQYIGLGLNTGLEVYVMKGGYCEFFRHYPQWCDPVGYLPMHDLRQSTDSADFDADMFVERPALSNQKDRGKRRFRNSHGYGSVSSLDTSPFFRSMATAAACSPMDYSPAGVVADLARVFIEEGPEDSCSGSSGAYSRGTANIFTEDDYDDNGGTSSDDGHSLLFRRFDSESAPAEVVSSSSPSRSSSCCSIIPLPAKRRASMSEKSRVESA